MGFRRAIVPAASSGSTGEVLPAIELVRVATLREAIDEALAQRAASVAGDPAAMLG
jgi:hypothetical protein